MELATPPPIRQSATIECMSNPRTEVHNQWRYCATRLSHHLSEVAYRGQPKHTTSPVPSNRHQTDIKHGEQAPCYHADQLTTQPPSGCALPHKSRMRLSSCIRAASHSSLNNDSSKANTSFSGYPRALFSGPPVTVTVPSCAAKTLTFVGLPRNPRAIAITEPRSLAERFAGEIIIPSKMHWKHKTIGGRICT